MTASLLSYCEGVFYKTSKVRFSSWENHEQLTVFVARTPWWDPLRVGPGKPVSCVGSPSHPANSHLFCSLVLWLRRLRLGNLPHMMTLVVSRTRIWMRTSISKGSGDLPSCHIASYIMGLSRVTWGSCLQKGKSSCSDSFFSFNRVDICFSPVQPDPVTHMQKHEISKPQSPRKDFCST